MRHSLSAAICALVLVSAPMAAQSDEGTAATLRSVAVTGDAEIRVPPDEVVLTLGVETFNESMQAAKADNDARVAAVIRAARARGVPERLAQTDYFVAEPRYESNSRGEYRVLGFIVRKTIVVTLRDMAAFEPLLTDALVAGATHIHGVDFRVTQLRAHRDSARTLAINAAREKAQALAGHLGRRVGAPLTINEGYNGWQSGYGAGWGSRGGGMSQNVVQFAPGGGPGASGGTTSPGQISIRASVSVTFELVPADAAPAR